MGQYSNSQTDITDVHISIVVSRFNEQITTALLDGAMNEFDRSGVTKDKIDVYYVPGSLELAVVAKTCASSSDAVVCLGAVVRGDTPHFDYVSQTCSLSIAQVAIETGVPCIFGVLTVDNIEQAKERIGGAHGHKGQEAASSALATIEALRTARDNNDTSHKKTTGFVSA